MTACRHSAGVVPRVGQTWPYTAILAHMEITGTSRSSAPATPAGIELLGEAGPTWQHFRGPDGNVYEIVAS